MRSSDLQWDDAALAVFLQCLDAYRIECGRPSYRELVRISPRVLGTTGAGGKQFKGLPELSLTAVSNVLNGVRTRPPRWPWVASFILTCQDYASSIPGLNPPAGTLADWQRRLNAVYIRPGDPGPADPPSADGPQPESAPRSAVAPVPPPPPSPADVPVPVGDRGPVTELLEDYVEKGSSLTEVRLFGIYGQYGATLLRAADADVAEAAYRLGVLLLVSGRPKESLYWLMRAEYGLGLLGRSHGSRHKAATRLVEDPAPLEQALQDAFALGRHAAGNGATEIAEVFLSQAGLAGHPGAAYELGLHLMERDEVPVALGWLRWAARCGHPHAGEVAQRLAQPPLKTSVPRPGGRRGGDVATQPMTTQFGP